MIEGWVDAVSARKLFGMMGGGTAATTNETNARDFPAISAMQ
jgi:hypothetical protein